MSKCYFKVGSVTQANKAKSELAKSSVYIKIKKSTDSNGCHHIIEFDCINKSIVSRVLLRNQINFEEYTQ